MYIRRIVLSNIRSIADLTWQPSNDHSGVGWHVIIGDNGSGKSTLLRAVALALIGPKDAIALRQDWNNWLTKDTKRGAIRLDLSYDPKFDKFSGKGALPKRYLLTASLGFVRSSDDSVRLTSYLTKAASRHVWGGVSGWFSVSYGPFRRFTGGDAEYERIFFLNQRLASHLSIFGENVALTEALRWLQELQFKKLEQRREGNLLEHIKTFINQKDFLPHSAQLVSVSSQGVEFVDGNNRSLAVEELSDGYRSVLSMTFELIRQLSQTYSAERIFDDETQTKVIVPGVVLIDEVDVHLHPTWQRKIGLWFREHFPNMQFIVTTHSPLVCQAATIGTVWRLPKPGSSEPGGMVSGTSLERLLYGNVLDAYSTEMFGPNVSRSEESKKKLLRLALLNRKELSSGLNEEERQEQKSLRSTLPTNAHGLEAMP